eukprot:GHVT01016459.1.p1 GENE.GHVT01016459.1~~GHVT01016459.1.p1  ORF type:complete len:135 (+),score=13.02 GHVT01016459.1:115-519(+)
MSAPSNFRESFALYDTNGDGELEYYQAVMALRACGVILTKDDMDQIPERLSWHQFSDFSSKKLETYNPEQNLQAAFAKFDRSKDGTFSSAEVREVLKNMSDLLTEQEIDEAVKEADPNGRGRIDYKRFVKVLLE